MDEFRVTDESLRQLIANETSASALLPEDDAYLSMLLRLIRSGKPAVIIAEDEHGKLHYMLSNASRPRALVMFADVIKAIWERLR